MTEPSAASPDEGAPGSAPARDVWELLAELHVRGVTVSLRTGQGQPNGASRVLAVDEKRGLLLLEGLSEGAAGVVAGDALHLESDLDDRRLGFDCKVSDVVNLPEGIAYLAGAPVLHWDISRRSSERTHLQPSMLLEAAISQRDSGKASAPVQVLDLSKGGFGVQSQSALDMPKGAHVHCVLALPDVKVFLEATVRHTQVGNEGVRIGLQFSDVTPILEAELQQAMQQIQGRLKAPEAGETSAAAPAAAATEPEQPAVQHPPLDDPQSWR